MYHVIYRVIRITLAFLVGVNFATATYAANDKPDVILLMTDQHRYDELSFLGTPGASTPAIDEICREGVVFTHAFVPTPQCSPARASIFTGRWPHRAGVVGNVSKRRVPAGQSGPLDPAIPSMGKVFKDAGYETAYFGKWHLGQSPEQCGFDTVGVSSGRAIALHIADFLQARKEKGEGKPLLLVVSWINPHDIYQINDDNLAVSEDIEAKLPHSVDDDLATKPPPQAQFLAEDQGIPFIDYSHAQWLRYVRYYHQLTSKVDDDIGRVRATLIQNIPDAITIFTADHGDLGGAHGLPYKCPAMYEELIRVPLVVSWPGRIQHKRSEELVNSIDLLPTMCDLAKIPTPNGIDGRSLKPILDSESSSVDWRSAMFGEYYGKQNWRAPIRMIRTKKWKYCRYTSYGEELYDLENDPSEMVNLAETPEYSLAKSELAERLEEWMQATDDDFPTLTVTDRKGKLIKVK